MNQILDRFINTIDAPTDEEVGPCTPEYLREAEKAINKGRRFIRDVNNNQQDADDANDEEEEENPDWLDEMEVQTPPTSPDDDGHGDCQGMDTCQCPVMSNGPDSDHYDPMVMDRCQSPVVSYGPDSDHSDPEITRIVRCVCPITPDQSEDSAEVTGESGDDEEVTIIEQHPAAATLNRPIAVVRPMPRQDTEAESIQNQPNTNDTWGSDNSVEEVPNSFSVPYDPYISYDSFASNTSDESEEEVTVILVEQHPDQDPDFLDATFE